MDEDKQDEQPRRKTYKRVKSPFEEPPVMDVDSKEPPRRRGRDEPRLEQQLSTFRNKPNQVFVSNDGKVRKKTSRTQEERAEEEKQKQERQAREEEEAMIKELVLENTRSRKNVRKEDDEYKEILERLKKSSLPLPPPPPEPEPPRPNPFVFADQAAVFVAGAAGDDEQKEEIEALRVQQLELQVEELTNRLLMAGDDQKQEAEDRRFAQVPVSAEERRKTVEEKLVRVTEMAKRAALEYKDKMDQLKKAWSGKLEKAKLDKEDCKTAMTRQAQKFKEDLAEERAKAQKAIADAKENASAEIEKGLAELDSKMRILQAENRQLVEDKKLAVKKAGEEAAKSSAAIMDLKKKLSLASETTAAPLNVKIVQLQGEIDVLKAKLVEEKQDKSQSNSENNTRISELEEELRTAKSEATTPLKLENAQLQGQNETLQSENAVLKTKLKTLQFDTNDAKLRREAEIKNDLEELDRLKDLTKEQATKVTQLTKKVEKLTSELATLQAEYNKKEASSVTEKQESQNRLDQAKLASVGTVLGLKEQITLLTTEKAQAEQERKELKRKLKELSDFPKTYPKDRKNKIHLQEVVSSIVEYFKPDRLGGSNTDIAVRLETNVKDDEDINEEVELKIKDEDMEHNCFWKRYARAAITALRIWLDYWGPKKLIEEAQDAAADFLRQGDNSELNTSDTNLLIQSIGDSFVPRDRMERDQLLAARISLAVSVFAMQNTKSFLNVLDTHMGNVFAQEKDDQAPLRDALLVSQKSLLSDRKEAQKAILALAIHKLQPPAPEVSKEEKKDDEPSEELLTLRRDLTTARQLFAAMIHQLQYVAELVPESTRLQVVKQGTTLTQGKEYQEEDDEEMKTFEVVAANQRVSSIANRVLIDPPALTVQQSMASALKLLSPDSDGKLGKTELNEIKEALQSFGIKRLEEVLKERDQLNAKVELLEKKEKEAKIQAKANPAAAESLIDPAGAEATRNNFLVLIAYLYREYQHLVSLLFDQLATKQELARPDLDFSNLQQAELVILDMQLGPLEEKARYLFDNEYELLSRALNNLVDDPMNLDQVRSASETIRSGITQAVRSLSVGEQTLKADKLYLQLLLDRRNEAKEMKTTLNQLTRVNRFLGQQRDGFKNTGLTAIQLLTVWRQMWIRLQKLYREEREGVRRLIEDRVTPELASVCGAFDQLLSLPFNDSPIEAAKNLFRLMEVDQGGVGVDQVNFFRAYTPEFLNQMATAVQSDFKGLDRAANVESLIKDRQKMWQQHASVLRIRDVLNANRQYLDVRAFLDLFIQDSTLLLEDATKISAETIGLLPRIFETDYEDTEEKLADATESLRSTIQLYSADVIALDTRLEFFRQMLGEITEAVKVYVDPMQVDEKSFLEQVVPEVKRMQNELVKVTQRDAKALRNAEGKIVKAQMEIESLRAVNYGLAVQITGIANSTMALRDLVIEVKADDLADTEAIDQLLKLELERAANFTPEQSKIVIDALTASKRAIEHLTHGTYLQVVQTLMDKVKESTQIAEQKGSELGKSVAAKLAVLTTKAQRREDRIEILVKQAQLKVDEWNKLAKQLQANEKEMQRYETQIKRLQDQEQKLNGAIRVLKDQLRDAKDKFAVDAYRALGAGKGGGGGGGDGDAPGRIVPWEQAGKYNGFRTLVRFMSKVAGFCPCQITTLVRLEYFKSDPSTKLMVEQQLLMALQKRQAAIPYDTPLGAEEVRAEQVEVKEEKAATPVLATMDNAMDGQALLVLERFELAQRNDRQYRAIVSDILTESGYQCLMEGWGLLQSMKVMQGVAIVDVMESPLADMAFARICASCYDSVEMLKPMRTPEKLKVTENNRRLIASCKYLNEKFEKRGDEGARQMLVLRDLYK